jgi:hypothetical protein
VSKTSVQFTPQALKDWLASSSRAKIARADEHLDALNAQIDRWGNLDPLAVSRECNADGSEHLWRVNYKIRPDVWRWAILLGDALFNLRGALDHMVYGLAIANTRTNPPADEAKLAFPICSEPKFFEGQRYRIASLSDAAQAGVEKAQPYNRLKPGQWFAPLWWLDQIHNIDKHRFAHLAGQAVLPDEIVIDADPGTYQVFWNRNTLVGGAPILRVVMNPPDPNVYVDLKAIAAIAIDAKGFPPMSVYWLTRHIRREVGLVCRYLEGFCPR